MSGGPSGSDEVIGLGFDVADPREDVARVFLPETRRVVDALGASEIAKVAIATIAGPAPLYVHAALGPLYDAVPARVRRWLEQSAERARWAAGLEVVDRKAGPAVDDGGGWAADESRVVHTIVGPLPLPIATKAALRTKNARKGPAAEAGDRLEPELVRRWSRLPATTERYCRIRAQHDTVARLAEVLRDHFPEGALYDAPRVSALRHPAGASAIDYADGFATSWDGEVEVINAKCTFFETHEVSAPNWIQAQAELGCAPFAARVVLPHGQRWAARYGRERPEERPISTFYVERNAPVIAALYPFAEAAGRWIREAAEAALVGRKDPR